MWLTSERGRYWVRTASLVIPLLATLLRAKSIIRYWPPKITAGFARCSERTDRRSPWPPARIMASTLFIGGPPGGAFRRYSTLPGGSSSVPRDGGVHVHSNRD